MPVLIVTLLLVGCGGSSGPAKAADANAGSNGEGAAAGTTGSAGDAPVNGGAPSAAAGAANGSAGTAAAAAGSGMNGAHVQPVTCQPKGERPAGAPKLTVGTWVDITPPGVKKSDEQTMIGQGITLDPCNPSVVYWGNTPYDDTYGGLFRSTDAGATWTKMGDRKADTDLYDNKTTYLDEPLHLRIDPSDNQHMYAGDGVRGGTQGFWVTTDGGNNWVRSAQWPAKKTGYDIYDVSVDPTDFKHAIATFHSWWPDTMTSGVVETKDGGTTWIVHEPQAGWGTGHSIKFLYWPDKNLGSASTWLLGTQGNGYYRTEDAGTTWTKVSDTGIAHGGGTLYLTAAGYIYASGYPHNIRSKDLGKTWEGFDPSGGFTCIFGDGNLLYTGKLNLGDPGEPLYVSPETDGATWKPFSTQLFRNGPYEMAMDSINNVLYSSNWTSGVWTMQFK